MYILHKNYNISMYTKYIHPYKTTLPKILKNSNNLSKNVLTFQKTCAIISRLTNAEIPKWL